MMFGRAHLHRASDDTYLELTRSRHQPQTGFKKNEENMKNKKNKKSNKKYFKEFLVVYLLRWALFPGQGSLLFKRVRSLNVPFLPMSTIWNGCSRFGFRLPPSIVLLSTNPDYKASWVCPLCPLGCLSLFVSRHPKGEPQYLGRALGRCGGGSKTQGIQKVLRYFHLFGNEHSSRAAG